MSQRLASNIRTSSESDTFDLGGQNTDAISKMITSAFSEPFPLNEMVRITLVTGAGKLGRARYDGGAAQAVTSALRLLSFEEDKGGSCILECAGTFKMQHDTGKNLKTVVVFPNITGDEGGDADGDEADGGGGSGSESPLPPNSPEYMVAVASVEVFERMIGSKCQSWLQKKECLFALQDVKEMIEGFEKKLLHGEALTDGEQDFYDAISGDALAAKEAHIKKELAAQVEAGKLTRAEKLTLVEQVGDKIAALNDEIADAEKDKKPVKLKKLKVMLTKAEERRKLLESITAQPPHLLKFEREIGKLRVELRPLTKLEDNAKGRLLTLKETTAISRKDEIIEEIQDFEWKSRDWFEDDESLDIRIENCRSKANAQDKQASRSKKSSSSSSYSSAGGSSKWGSKATTKFVTPGAKRATAKPKAKKTPGGVFAAMMGDSSDSD